jgi:hypothetical protein
MRKTVTKKPSPTRPPKKSRTAIQPSRLEDLPNIGRQIADALRAIGIQSPAQLRSKKPLTVFNDLKPVMGRRHDPCVFYTLLAVEHFFETSKSLSWWHFTAQGKAKLKGEQPK